MKKGYFTSARIAYLGVMMALVFALLALETFIFQPILQIPAAILTIPFAISLCLGGEKSDVFVGGTILGVCSFILSFIVGYVPCMNPLISVLPRLFIGLIVGGVFYLAEKSQNKALCFILGGALLGLFVYLTYTLYSLLGLSFGLFMTVGIVLGVTCYLEYVIFTKLDALLQKRTFSYILSGISGVLTNTVLFLTMLVLFFKEQFAFTLILSSIVSINCVFELLGAIILVPLLAPLIKKLKDKFILKK